MTTKEGISAKFHTVMNERPVLINLGNGKKGEKLSRIEWIEVGIKGKATVHQVNDRKVLLNLFCSKHQQDWIKERELPVHRESTVRTSPVVKLGETLKFPLDGKKQKSKLYIEVTVTKENQVSLYTQLFGATPMKTHYGPWSTAIQPGSSSQLGTFWKRRLVMLQTVSRCRPVTIQAWVYLIGLGIFTWALPTVSVSSVLAQSPSQQSEKPKQTESQPIPQLKTADDLPKAVTRKDSQILPSEIYGLSIKSTEGHSLNFMEIMNSYFEAVKKLRSNGFTLEQMQPLRKRGAITLFELQSLQFEIETARRKMELIRQITSVTRASAEDELKLLSEEKKLVGFSVEMGKSGIDKLMKVRRRELQVRSNLKFWNCCWRI
jgi:hypothetical protein